MARQIDGIRRMLLIINKIYATNGQYGNSCVSVHIFYLYCLTFQLMLQKKNNLSDKTCLREKYFL